MKKIIEHFSEMEEWIVLPVAFIIFAISSIAASVILSKILFTSLLGFTFFVIYKNK